MRLKLVGSESLSLRAARETSSSGHSTVAVDQHQTGRPYSSWALTLLASVNTHYSRPPTVHCFSVPLQESPTTQIIMTTEQDHVHALSQALDTIASRFYVSGTHKSPISLTVAGSTCSFPMSLGDAAQQLQALQQHARPSAFGR